MVSMRAAARVGDGLSEAQARGYFLEQNTLLESARGPIPACAITPLRRQQQSVGGETGGSSP